MFTGEHSNFCTQIPVRAFALRALFATYLSRATWALPAPRPEPSNNQGEAAESQNRPNPQRIPAAASGQGALPPSAPLASAFFFLLLLLGHHRPCPDGSLGDGGAAAAAGEERREKGGEEQREGPSPGPARRGAHWPRRGTARPHYKAARAGKRLSRLRWRR